MRDKKKVMHTSLVAAVQLVGLIFILFIVLFGPKSFTGYATFSTDGQTSFDNGTYNQTFYNDTGNYIQLDLTYYNGTYTSDVFDSGMRSKWQDISWSESVNESLGSITFQAISCENNNCNDSDFSDVYTDSSGSSLNLDDNRYVQYRINIITLDINYSPLIYNATINYENILVPTINLISPANYSTASSENISFTHYVYSFADISNCSLIWNHVVDTVHTNILKDTSRVFSKTSISNGNYTWYINCTDQYGQVNSSLIYNLSVAYTPEEEEEDDDDDSSSTPATSTESTPITNIATSSDEEDDEKDTFDLNLTIGLNESNSTKLNNSDDWVGNMITGFSTFAGGVVEWSKEDLILFFKEVPGFLKSNWVVLSASSASAIIVIILSFWFGIRKGKKKDKIKAKEVPKKGEKKSIFDKNKAPKPKKKKKSDFPDEDELREVLS